jgi:uncharacterized protein YdaU (DUF1376 family)
MHYYRHHIGDFRRDTASLSDTDAMAYLKLLWMYYDTEQPLPANPQLLAFKIGANTESVQLILDAFFTLDGDVYRQKRCDAELEEYRNKGKKARDSANARWNNAKAMPTDSERNANASIFDANQEPITNNQIKEKKVIVPLELPDWLNKTDWNDFVEMRKKLKKPMTDRAVKLMLSKLETMKNKGINTSEVLQKSILANWSDVYEPKVQTQQNSMGRRVL